MFAVSRPNPSLSLDFTSGAVSPLVSVARALGTATRVNASGLIEAVSADTARLDFDPVSLRPVGLLVEESRTNLHPGSADMANPSYWATVRASWPGTTSTAPDGTSSAQKLVEDGSPSTTHIGLSFSNVAVVATKTYTTTIYAKAAERNWFLLQEGQTVTANAYFDLANGTVGNSGGTGFVSANIKDAGAGWYRCSLTFTTTGTAARIRMYLATGNGAAVYSGDGSSGIFFWGAQMEDGADATSYIPTTSAAVGRNADVATITGTNFSDWWQAGKGSALVRARPSTVSGTRPLIQFDDATTDNIIALRGNDADPELYVRTGGVDQAQIDAGTMTADTSYRLAGAWAENSCAASLNSGTPVLDGVATIPAVTQTRLGSDGTNYLNGHIEAIEYYDERVPNSALQVVSSTAGYQSIIGSVFRDAIIS